MVHLISLSCAILRALEIEKLEAEGFTRDRRKYEYIVTYPPARALHPFTPEEVYSEMRTAGKMHFYVHLPFCYGKNQQDSCTFCGRYEKWINPSPDLVEEYLDYLTKEMRIMRTLPELKEIVLATVYIGGGTPTFLEPLQIARLGNDISALLSIAEGAEYTVEGHPITIDSKRLDAWLSAGANRFSLGVQDMHNDTLALCNRRHRGIDAKGAAELVKVAGFRNFNIDLMIGLPNQTPERFEENLWAAVHLGATCVTTYPMYIRPSCNIGKLDDSQFPDQRQNLLMQVIAKEFFRKIGWNEGPIHYFSRPGVISQDQNNRKWSGAENIGIGRSTYQFVNNCQFHNQFDYGRYKQMIDTGRLPVWIGKRLNREEQMARTMVLGMKKGQVDKTCFVQRFGLAPEDAYPATLERLVKLGLIELKDKSIDLTYTGSLFSEEIAILFYSDKTKAAIGEGGYCNYSLAELPDI